jgi:hypothetical protein
MKPYIYSLAAILGLVLSAAAQAPLRVGDVKLEKIYPSVVKTPEYSYTGGSQKRSRLGDWLEVEVEYQTAAELIDELTFNYKILVNGKLLTGEVTHISIPKGREHFSVAYVAPRALESLMGGKQLSAAAIQGIWVDCSRQGQVLSTVSTVKAPVPNLPQLPGFVLNKSQTPFSILYWDRYEALKPKP